MFKYMTRFHSWAFGPRLTVGWSVTLWGLSFTVSSINASVQVGPLFADFYLGKVYRPLPGGFSDTTYVDFPEATDDIDGAFGDGTDVADERE